MEITTPFKEIFDMPCNEHNFFQNVRHLTLNENISWCTKWATQIKLNKLEISGSSNTYNTTLQSPNLINLYPKPKTPIYLTSYYTPEIQQDFFYPNANYTNSFFQCQKSVSH